MASHHSTCRCPTQGNGNIYYNSLNEGRRHYGPFRFLFDVFMLLITSGFWAIWIILREMRNRR